MQCLHLKENFIFSTPCDMICDEGISASNIDIKKYRLLVTITSMYCFTTEVPSSKDNSKEIKLEDMLYFKIDHSNLYLKDFNDNDISYFAVVDNNSFSITYKIKNSQCKELIRILLIIQGWYMAAHLYEHQYGKSISPNHLFKILDKMIINNYVLHIDNEFFLLDQAYPGFLERFTPFFCHLHKIKFDVFFKTNTIKTMTNLLQGHDVIMLLHLSCKSTNMTDDYFNKLMVQILTIAQNLETLDLSNNLLTNKIFDTIINKFPIAVRLKTFNLSYNNITNTKFNYYLPFLVKNFIFLTLFDLRGNKIDNTFLENFNPKNIEEIKNQLETFDIGTKEPLVFDFRNTNIHIDKLSSSFYLKKKKDISNHIEIKNVFADNFENKFFSFDKFRFLFDIIFYKKNPSINGLTKNVKVVNIDCKYFQIHKKKSFRLVPKILNYPQPEIENENKGKSNTNLINISQNRTHNSNFDNQNAHNKSDDTIKKTINNIIEEEQKSFKNQPDGMNEINDPLNKEQSDNNIKVDNTKNYGYNNNYDAEIIYDTDDEEEIKSKKLEEEKKSNNNNDEVLSPEQIHDPNNVIGYFIDRQPQLELYRELFIFFFLLDYYFDPVLNSFSSYESKYIPRLKDFMNQKIQNEQFEKLKGYFPSKKNSINSNILEEKTKKDKDKEKKIYREIPLDEAFQIYYDYKNLLCPYILTRNSRNQIEVQPRTVSVNDLVNNLFEKIFQKKILKEDEQFSPNCHINELSYFFLYLQLPHDYKIKIPFTTLNKYISRVKIESAICIKEKSHNSLNYLSKISSRLKLSVQTPVMTTFNRVNQKAEIILQGIGQALNYEGQIVEKCENNQKFLFESNNYLDIFINKADSINLVDDLVFLAKYIQFLRNNQLRYEISLNLIDLYQKESSITTYNMYEEFSPANKAYIAFTDPMQLNIPTEIIHKELALHPSHLDYLALSELSEKDCIEDLGVISRLIASNQSYGKRNLYDRLKFLFVNSSKKKKNEDYLYRLHKKNLFLKIMRVLFRYFNAIDFKEFQKKLNLDLSKSEINHTNSNILMNSSSFVATKTFTSQNMKLDESKSILNSGDIQSSLENIAIEERNLRIMESENKTEEEKNLSKIEYENRKKIELLKYCDNLAEPVTLLDISQVKDITIPQIERFTQITMVFFSKCQEMLSIQSNLNDDSFCTIVQGYIKYYLEVKNQFSQDTKYWELQNLECFYQLFRFANKNNFENEPEPATKENENNVNHNGNFNNNNSPNHKNNPNGQKAINQDNKEDSQPKINYPFAFLYIMCWYFEFNETMIRRVKGFVYYLFSHMIQRKYCKGIIRALNNPFRYTFPMSTYEIIKKITNKPLTVEVTFPSANKIKEKYEITETTTIGDLFQKVKYNSEILSESIEKGLYWIYYVSNDKPCNFQYLINEDLIVELIGINEESEAEYEKALEGKMKNKNIIKTKESKNIESNEEQNRKSISSKKKTFKKMHFEIRRRIFSPSICKGEISSFTYFEQEMLFHQIKNIFFNSQFVDYTWYGVGEEIAIACYFESLAQQKRDAFITKSKLDAKAISMPNVENMDFSFDENKNDKKNDSRNNLSNYSLNQEINQEDKKDMSLFDQYINPEIVIDYPKSLGKINPRTSSALYNKVKNKITQLKHPKMIFFDLIKNYPILLSNIFEVSVKQCNDSFPEKFYISISLEKVQFLYRKNYRKFLEFKYDEIVKCFIIDEITLILTVNLPKDDVEVEEKRFELFTRLETLNCRNIMEDILSYSQIYLITHTNSSLVTFTDGIINLKDYQLIYQRNLAFREFALLDPEPYNDKDIKKMRDNMHNTQKYKDFKANKEKKKKEEEEKKKEQEKKGKFTVEKAGGPNYLEENVDLDSEEDDDVPVVNIAKIQNISQKNDVSNTSKVEKSEVSQNEKAANSNEKDLTEEELKFKREEEERKKKEEEEEKRRKEEEEKILKEKQEINFAKKLKANQSLSRAIEALMDDSDEEEQRSEDNEDEYY